jgi:hypothetical protein
MRLAESEAEKSPKRRSNAALAAGFIQTTLLRVWFHMKAARGEKRRSERGYAPATVVGLFANV